MGTYLHALNAAIPVNLSSAIAMAVVTVLAVLRIHVGAILAAIFLSIEIVVIAAAERRRPHALEPAACPSSPGP